MDIIKKIFLTIFLIAVLLFVGLSVFIHYNGKVLIEERLSHALKKEVHVGEARVLFPFGIRFDNIEIKDSLQAKALRIKLGVPLFLGGQVNIAKVNLTEPVFYFTRSAEKKMSWGKPLEQSGESSAPPSSPAAPAVSSVPSTPSSKGILINYLEIENGSVKFFDQAGLAEIDIGQIDLKALSIPLPAKNLNSKFDLTALIVSTDVPFAGRKVEARGTVNIIGRDMDASLKIVDPDGNSGLAARLKSVNNDMLVKGKVNVGRFVSGVKTKDAKESSLEGFLSDALESSGVEIGINFTCQTKMDDFNCDKLSMSGNVVPTPKEPGPLRPPPSGASE